MEKKKKTFLNPISRKFKVHNLLQVVRKKKACFNKQIPDYEN